MSAPSVMLKKISVDDLRLGMHLHEMCGSWMDHPFWKSRFVLRDPADLAKLRDSGLKECWIDATLGLDVAAPAPAPMREGTAPAQLRVVAPSPPAAAVSVTIEEELSRAAALVDRSRQAVMSLYSEARMGRAIDAEQSLPLVADIASSVWRNPGALIGLARLKTHDDYSYMHSVAVCALMVSLARQLGHDEAQAREAGLAGLLHDIGKALIPLGVLNKPGKLTATEFDIIKTHPKRGYELLLEGASATGVVLDVCHHHHERPDGKGYPHGLQDSKLSIMAKMGAVCDVYDAITSNRPYKAGWDPAESIARMSEWGKGGQFDADIYLAFLKCLGVYPIGALVRMQSARLGVVIEQNAQQLLKPKVKVFFSTRSQLPVTPTVVDTAHPACTDRIVGRESNSDWKFKYLDELWAGREALARARRSA